MTKKREIAVVGGGLAGLSTAYQLLQLEPQASITLFEKGDYPQTGDTSRRASQSASGARTIRLTGASSELGQSMVYETKAMLETLEADMSANPAAYGDLAGKKLFTPQPAAIIAPDADDAFYQKSLAALKTSNADHEEITGAELKARHPGLYKEVLDSDAVLYEAPGTPENTNGVAGLMNTPVIMAALRRYIENHGGKVLTGQRVENVADITGKALVQTAEGNREFDHAVIAPGQWIDKLVDTQEHGIKLRKDRVIVLDIDLKALGIESQGIPFTKGFGSKEHGKVGLYSHEPNPEEGHAKLIPAATTRSVESNAELRAPISADEMERALTAAGAALGIDRDLIRPHAKASVCAYTSPRYKENQLVTPLSEHVTLNGLDSSGSARNCAGLGLIAASQALGRPEPYPGANEAFSLAAHRKLVNNEPEVKEPTLVEKLVQMVQQVIGL